MQDSVDVKFLSIQFNTQLKTLMKSARSLVVYAFDFDEVSYV